jgi:hypothetical protein
MKLPTGLISLPEAQRLLAEHSEQWREKYLGQKLRRYILRREKVLTCEIMIRHGSRAVVVDMATLKKHCPELFPRDPGTRRKMPEEFRELLREQIVEHLTEILDATLEPRVRLLEMQMDGRVE